MPPRKRARHSQADSPSPSQPTTSSPLKPPSPTALDDAWTDYEEIGLFKGLVIWKPTGMHKHFRLLALYYWLLENSYIHPRNEHTKPKGIRTKLETLYNMDALDAREDARQLPVLEAEERSDAKGTVLDDNIYSQADNRIEGDDFALPAEEGFEKEMWDRRIRDKTEEESEAELPELNLAPEPPVRFVATVSIEPSEAATPGSRKGKSGGVAGSRRKSVQKDKVGTTTRRSARQAESTADEEEEGGGEEEEGGDAEDEEEVENSASEDQSQASTTPAPRTSSRSTKGRRGRGNVRARRVRRKK